MCYGFDGERALRASLDARGVGRRSFLRGAVGAAAAGVGAAGLGTLPAQAAPAAARGHGKPVPPGKISIQLYTMRSDLATKFDETLTELAKIGYRKVEQAGYYGRTAAQLREFYDSLGIRATSSHDGISGSPEALEQ